MDDDEVVFTLNKLKKQSEEMNYKKVLITENKEDKRIKKEVQF